jgi:hypothetical protein
MTMYKSCKSTYYKIVMPMDAFGVVYPEYRLQPKLEIRFVAHLTILKATP